VSTATYSAAARAVVVTPRTGIGLSGYLDRTAAAHARLDHLEAGLIWIAGASGSAPDDGVLWVSIDALAVTARTRQAVVAAIGEATGIDTSRVVVVASHTHAGPGAWHEPIHPVFTDQFDDDELAHLAATIAGGVRGLRDDARPATLHWRSAAVSGVGGNRHRPDGPHDPSLGLLEIRDAATHQPIALVYDYACHPTVLGPDNTRWSADWVGAARRRVRDGLDGRLPVVFLQGCAGDASTRFHRRERGDAELARLGGLVADRILELLTADAAPLEARPVRIDRTTLRLPVRSDRAADIHRADDRIGRGAASGHEGERCLEALAEADLPAELKLPVSIVTVGTRCWMHVPVEMCASYGLAIAAGREDVRVIGYSDAYAGYVADRRTYREGHYEALTSYFDEETSHRMMIECRAYLASVYETSRS